MEQNNNKAMYKDMRHRISIIKGYSIIMMLLNGPILVMGYFHTSPFIRKMPLTCYGLRFSHPYFYLDFLVMLVIAILAFIFANLIQKKWLNK